MRLIWLLLAAVLVAGAVAGVRVGTRDARLAAHDAITEEPSTTSERPAIADSPAADYTLASPADLPRPSASPAAPPPPSPSEGPPAPAPASSDTPAPIGAAGTPASLEKLADGEGFLLDGRFLLRGRGTDVDPLRVPWDLLLSARETYDPLKEKFDLPSRISALTGQVVSLTGYFAAPPGTEETRELMVMLNKWDGCCIGLPPTPYDAVEVALEKPVTLRGKHMIRYGTVTGRFECEPFLVGGWLVGMYRLRDARLE